MYNWHDVRWHNVRQRAEEKEEQLSPFAARSKQTKGRPVLEEACPIRTAFQRDRDRIIHSKAFRRLKHKTQVFIAPLSDHYVTRLTHTLEVSQIARTISRALNLNEDLTEAICLGHDLGHTPFGHIGEEVLDEICRRGFHHNEQSLRVVDVLENDGKGLNLTWEVRDGILNHSKSRADIMGIGAGNPGTLEGQICKLADAIAYINHDIGDAVRDGIITENSLPVSAVQVLGLTHSQRINNLVCDIVNYSWGATGLEQVTTPAIGMSALVLESTNILRDFLFENVYRPQTVQKDARIAREVVRALYGYFTTHAEKLPREYLAYIDDTERRTVDYIAGMTDRYALRTAEELGLVKIGSALKKISSYLMEEE